ncbi:hypothetical protein WN48_09645 [Eufriesea mexicana]|uniref:Uncharacterized protein n=1 Tax=Eufriesea mexicana TaxID=516756 RepID=A0A310SJQ0_9HYME|nr:hypothetical protein WN48_09645 [Eufriesea mexicana]
MDHLLGSPITSCKSTTAGGNGVPEEKGPVRGRRLRGEAIVTREIPFRGFIETPREYVHAHPRRWTFLNAARDQRVGRHFPFPAGCRWTNVPGVRADIEALVR